jgi:hypothetical protein
MRYISSKINFILLLLLLGLLVGCTYQDASTLKALNGVEVQEYQGKKLDSMADVRDVSINGPQHVNIDTYRLQITGLVEEPKSYTYDEVLVHQKYSKVVALH